MFNGLGRMSDLQPFSANGMLLAYRLLDHWNRLHRPGVFGVDQQRMMSMIGCTSRHTIQAAVEELIRRGVLERVEQGKRGKTAQYRLCDLSESCAEYRAKNAPNQESCAELCAKNDRNTAPLNKVRDISDSDNILAVPDKEVLKYQEGIGAIEEAAKGIGLPFAATDFPRAERLMADYSLEWVLKAIERASLRNRTWGVVEGILKSWKSKGGMDDAGRSHDRAGGAGKPAQGAARSERKYDMSSRYL